MQQVIDHGCIIHCVAAAVQYCFRVFSALELSPEIVPYYSFHCPYSSVFSSCFREQLSTMATATLAGEPSQRERLEAEAEAGMGANAQALHTEENPIDNEDRLTIRTDDTAVNTVDEKSAEAPGLSSSASVGDMAATASGPPPQEEKHRSKGKILLLMLALCVCLDPGYV